MTKTREEMLKVSETLTSSRTVEWARKFLDKGMYMPLEEEVTVSCLAFIILQLAWTDNIKIAVSDGLKAVALLIEQTQNDRAVESIVSTVTDRLTTMLQENLSHRNKHTEDELEAAKNLCYAAISLTNTIEEKCEEIQRVTGQLTEVSENISTQPTPAFLAPAMTQSYADIAQQQPPLSGHADIIARGRNMERQVIIDKALDATMNGMMNLTEKELVTKANLTIKMMNDDSMLRGTTFVGATKLKNGGTILQLNSKDAVDWLHGEDTANTFLGQLGGTLTMKTHLLNTHTLKRPIPIYNGRPEPDTFPLTMGPAGRPRIMTEPRWQWIGRGCLPLCY